jgi:spore coat polysaccharide biosynthesis protein SpsF
MKIGYIILSRYNSRRLPGKALMQIKNKAILQHIVDKLLLITDIDNIVVATSIEQTDNSISDYCKANNINVFRGDLNNVAKRFLDCAQHFNFDFAARINGDNIFVDPNLIFDMTAAAKTNQSDFVSNVKGRTFPKGWSVEIVRVSHYQEQYAEFNISDDFEHVTSYLYKNDKNKNYKYFCNEICPDTMADFELAKNIFSKFTIEKKYYDLKDIYHLYKIAHERKQPF